MTPSARLSAAIEILDEIATTRGPADGVIKAWGRNHRFAGSKDRKAIAEHVYVALRARARSQWRMGSDKGRALILGVLADQPLEEIETLFATGGHGPEPLSHAERNRLIGSFSSAPDWVDAGIPEWIAPIFQRRYGDAWVAEGQAAILQRAPVDLRVNALRGPVDKALNLLAHEGVEPQRTVYSAWGLRLPAGFATDVHTLKAFTTGWVEVQDEASQIAAYLAGAKPGGLAIDYCAGGGGKTLALAASLSGRGRLIASDIDQRRLDAMGERLTRAAAKVEVRKLGANGEGMDDLDGLADLVFVDAPCSGSGTWRRHPEAAWRLDPETIERLSGLQRKIAARAAKLVKPGGRLLYATCSMLEAENEAVALAFASDHPWFRPVSIAEATKTANLTDAARDRLAGLAAGGHTLQLTPHRTGTDGFFAAIFERTA